MADQFLAKVEEKINRMDRCYEFVSSLVKDKLEEFQSIMDSIRKMDQILGKL